MLSHRRLNLNLETKKQSAKYEEENISAVSSWTAVTQGFIQEQSLFMHVLSNIVGYLYNKVNEEQNIMAE